MRIGLEGKGIQNVSCWDQGLFKFYQILNVWLANSCIEHVLCRMWKSCFAEKLDQTSPWTHSNVPKTRIGKCLTRDGHKTLLFLCWLSRNDCHLRWSHCNEIFEKSLDVEEHLKQHVILDWYWFLVTFRGCHKTLKSDKAFLHLDPVSPTRITPFVHAFFWFHFKTSTSPVFVPIPEIKQNGDLVGGLRLDPKSVGQPALHCTAGMKGMSIDSIADVLTLEPCDVVRILEEAKSHPSQDYRGMGIFGLRVDGQLSL